MGTLPQQATSVHFCKVLPWPQLRPLPTSLPHPALPAAAATAFAPESRSATVAGVAIMQAGAAAQAAAGACASFVASRPAMWLACDQAASGLCRHSSSAVLLHLTLEHRELHASICSTKRCATQLGRGDCVSGARTTRALTSCPPARPTPARSRPSC